MTTVLTSRERTHLLLRRELPDRMGLFEHFWPETIRDVWSGQGYPADVPPETYFGYDLRFGGGWIDTTPLRGTEEVVEETAEHRLVRHGNGALMRYWTHKSGTPEHVDFDCITPERWAERYQAPLLALDPARVNVDGTRENIAKAHAEGAFTFFGGLFVFELLRSTLGDVAMLESFALEPEWIHDFCRTYTDFLIRHLDYLFEHAGQPDGAFIYEDLGYNKGLFCSPKMLNDLIMPYYRELFAYFHNRGMPVILHSCGNVTDAVPLVIEAGIDCLQPMEAKAGCDVVALARQYGDKIAFMGNLDVRIFEAGDPYAIEAEVAGKMDALKALGAAYFFHTDHSVSPNVSLDAYRHAIDVYRAHCTY
jgi:uroporphyrinogen decarboxylase